jgi:hypothetical protein
MKKLRNTILITFAFAILVFNAPLYAQSLANTLIPVYDLTGKRVTVNELIPQGQQVRIIFWNSLNTQHIEYLDNLNTELENETDPEKIIIISTDKYHNIHQLKAITSTKGWTFDVYVDVNEQFSRGNAVCDIQLQTYHFENGVKKSNQITWPGMIPKELLVDVPDL